MAVRDEVGGCFTYRFAWVLWVVLGFCFSKSNKQSRLEGRVRNASAYLYLVFGIYPERGIKDRRGLKIIFDFQLLIFALACSAMLALYILDHGDCEPRTDKCVVGMI